MKAFGVVRKREGNSQEITIQVRGSLVANFEHFPLTSSWPCKRHDDTESRISDGWSSDFLKSSLVFGGCALETACNTPSGQILWSDCRQMPDIEDM